ncbi:hypothetical protein ATANTOWER_012451 [Ataeniobius toweri]|uniref:Uncharacterized protein n=1 Tax=Ataeniobius toweri TaxID=208326 RepID=A0ABU7C2K1_9TELE|nr:hypothetical protein [Ataeniobius toweri]
MSVNARNKAKTEQTTEEVVDRGLKIRGLWSNDKSCREKGRGLKERRNGGRLPHYSHREKGEGWEVGDERGEWASHTLRIRKHMQWSSEGLEGEGELEGAKEWFLGGEEGCRYSARRVSTPLFFCSASPAFALLPHSLLPSSLKL